MRCHLAVAVLFLSGVVLLSARPSVAQDDSGSSEGSRKLVTRVVPAYPALAKQFNVRGNVKLEAIVASDGTVKSVSAKGGHPLLVDAAQQAVKQWKYAPGHETTETIEVHFNP